MLTDNLQQFVLVGESAAQSAAVKQLRVVVASPPPSPGGELTVVVYIIQDTAASLACKLIYSLHISECLPSYPHCIYTN